MGKTITKHVARSHYGTHSSVKVTTDRLGGVLKVSKVAVFFSIGTAIALAVLMTLYFIGYLGAFH